MCFSPKFDLMSRFLKCGSGSEGTGMQGANLHRPGQAWKVAYGLLGRRTNLIAFVPEKKPH